MGILDRYLFKRSATVVFLILLLALVLGIFFDVVLNLESYMSARIDPSHNRWSLVAQLYACRLPLILLGILPFVVVAGALVCLAPMLRRGEWTAVIAGGLSPQRISLPLCVLAIGAGTFLICCNNILNPRLFHQVQAIEALFENKLHTARVWHIKENNATWYAARSFIPKNDNPSFETVFIAPASGGVVYAQSMTWDGHEWKLHPPIIQWLKTTNEETIIRHETLALSGELGMPLNPEYLRQELLTREAFTGIELWQRGDHMYLTLLLNRCMALFVPLLAIMYALPSFMRFHNQQRILVAASKSLIYAAIPVSIIALTGMAADASNWSPWLSSGIGFLCASIPGVYRFSRWTA